MDQRALTLADLDWVTGLAAARRARLAPFAPRFWNPSPCARAAQSAFSATSSTRRTPWRTTLGLWREAAENAGRPPDTREAVTALIGRDPDAVIVAEHDGQLIGSVIAGWDGWRCHLYRLAMRWCSTATTSVGICGGPAVTAGRKAGAVG